MKHTLRHLLIVSAAFCILTLIAMAPAPLHWNTRMAGGSWDTGQQVWNFWRVTRSIGQGNFFPYFTDSIYAPNGVSLAFHPVNIPNSLIAYGLTGLFHLSLAGAYNTILLLSAVLAGTSCYWLVRHITGSASASFVAALIFTFSPTQFSALHYGHSEIFTSVQFVPLTIYLVICAVERQSWQRAALAGLLLGLTGWWSLHMGLGAALLVALVYAFWGYREKRLTMRWLLLTGLVALLIMVPAALPALRDYRDFYGPASVATPSKSQDLLHYITPDRAVSAFWRFALGKLTDQPLTDFYQIHPQGNVFAGYGVLLLLGLSLFFVPFKRAWKYWAVAAVFGLLSMGPSLMIGGRELMPMPYALVEKIPILGLGRVPARWFVFASLCFGLLIGLLCAALIRRRAGFKWLVLAAGLGIYLELLAVPVQLDQRLETVPAYYYQLAQTPAQGVVLDVPYDLIGSFGPACDYMVYQVIHQKPIASGYISRAPAYATQMFDGDPFIRQLRARLYGDKEPVAFTPAMIQGAPAELAAHQIEFVILHRGQLSEADYNATYRALVQALARPEYEDSQRAVWHLPVSHSQMNQGLFNP